MANASVSAADCRMPVHRFAGSRKHPHLCGSRSTLGSGHGGSIARTAWLRVARRVLRMERRCVCVETWRMDTAAVRRGRLGQPSVVSLRAWVVYETWLLASGEP